MAKIAIKYDNIVPYGGFFLVVPLPMSLYFFLFAIQNYKLKGRVSGLSPLFFREETQNWLPDIFIGQQ